jgi:hypothetical protein
MAKPKNLPELILPRPKPIVGHVTVRMPWARKPAPPPPAA